MTNKEIIAYQICQGNLQMPRISNFKEKFGSEVVEQVAKMFEALWRAYLKKGYHLNPKGEFTNVISMPYWAKRINNPKAHNIALMALSKAGWITVATRPNNNWSEAWLNEPKLLQYVSKQDLIHVRLHNKFKGVILENEVADESCATITKIKGKKLNTGITRNGFAKAANVEFQFDVEVMEQYKDVVKDSINKGIVKMINKYPQIANDYANYKELGKEVVDAYIATPSTYRPGKRSNDPRGRDNAGYL